jgi:hypothetical protein
MGNDVSGRKVKTGMKKMALRVAAFWAIAAAALPGGAAAPVSLRGKLIQPEGRPAIETAEHKVVRLEASDEPIGGVLADKRLAGSDVEVLGHYAAPDRFVVDPVHTRPVFVHKGGKRLYVTYWCEVCAIRTYTPGKCWCCQKETDLDLRETEQ